jgi:hypothetical protein
MNPTQIDHLRLKGNTRSMHTRDPDTREWTEANVNP